MNSVEPGSPGNMIRLNPGRPGWQHRELATSHLPFITNPLELANVLMEAVG